MTKVNKIEATYGASFSILSENFLAVSEISIIDKGNALLYLDLIDNKNQKLIKLLEKTLQGSDSVYFFNRLSVPKSLRKQGYGKLLLEETLNFCKEKNALLINTANEYGEMGQNNLIDFYEKGGMLLVHDEGLLVYHESLKAYKDNNISITKNQSKKSKIK